MREFTVTLSEKVIVPVWPASPKVKANGPTPSVIVVTPMAALPLFNVESAVIVVAPRSIWVLVVATVPAMLTPPAETAPKPPIKVELSVLSLPMVVRPVLRKSVSLSITLAAPSKLTA